MIRLIAIVISSLFLTSCDPFPIHTYRPTQEFGRVERTISGYYETYYQKALPHRVSYIIRAHKKSKKSLIILFEIFIPGKREELSVLLDKWELTVRSPEYKKEITRPIGSLSAEFPDTHPRTSASRTILPNGVITGHIERPLVYSTSFSIDGPLPRTLLIRPPKAIVNGEEISSSFIEFEQTKESWIPFIGALDDLITFL